MLVSPTPTTKKDHDDLRQQLLEGMEEGTHASVINMDIVSIAKKDEEDDNDEEKKNDKGLIFALGMASGVFYHILLWLYMIEIARDLLYHKESISTIRVCVPLAGHEITIQNIIFLAYWR